MMRSNYVSNGVCIWICIFIATRCIHTGESVLLAQNNFTITFNEPYGYGVWGAQGYCNFSFPGDSISTPDANIFTRFDVAYSAGTYDLTHKFVPEDDKYLEGPSKDYLYGTTVSEDPANRWVVVEVGWPSSFNDMLPYRLNFQYQAFLGEALPAGDCKLYNSQAEALAESSVAPLFQNATLADPLLGTSPMVIGWSTTYSGSTNAVDVDCSFHFHGVKYGAGEAYLFLNFTIPISDYSDLYQGIIQEMAPDNTWCIILLAYSRTNYFNANFEIRIEASDEPYLENYGGCALYVSLAAAQSATVGSSAGMPTTTSTTPIPTTIPTSVPATTSTTPIPTTIPTSVPATTSTTPIPTTTPTSVPATTSTTPTPAVYPTTTFAEMPSYRNTDVLGTSIWTSTENVLRCSRKCHLDSACVAITFHSVSGLCTGLSDVTGNGDDVIGNVLYMVQ